MSYAHGIRSLNLNAAVITPTLTATSLVLGGLKIGLNILKAIKDNLLDSAVTLTLFESVLQ